MAEDSVKEAARGLLSQVWKSGLEMSLERQGLHLYLQGARKHLNPGVRGDWINLV